MFPLFSCLSARSSSQHRGPFRGADWCFCMIKTWLRQRLNFMVNWGSVFRDYNGKASPLHHPSHPPPPPPPPPNPMGGRQFWASSTKDDIAMATVSALCLYISRARLGGGGSELMCRPFDETEMTSLYSLLHSYVMYFTSANVIGSLQFAC